MRKTSFPGAETVISVPLSGELAVSAQFTRTHAREKVESRPLGQLERVGTIQSNQCFLRIHFARTVVVEAKETTCGSEPGTQYSC